MDQPNRLQRLLGSLSPWAAALWWGGLTVIGGLVVPLLFVHLPSPAAAGAMAARLFTAQTWLSVACALLLLLASRGGPTCEATALRLQSAQAFVLGGLLLALLVEFAVAPRIVAREQLALWHRIGSAMYAVQWLCATLVLRRVLRPQD